MAISGKKETKMAIRAQVIELIKEKPLDEIKTIQEDMEYVMENRDKIVQRYNDIFVEIQSR